jgi:hypothetical protein
MVRAKNKQSKQSDDERYRVGVLAVTPLEQSDPVRPSAHTHALLMHNPLLEHPLGHVASTISNKSAKERRHASNFTMETICVGQ